MGMLIIYQSNVVETLKMPNEQHIVSIIISWPVLYWADDNSSMSESGERV